MEDLFFGGKKRKKKRGSKSAPTTARPGSRDAERDLLCPACGATRRIARLGTYSLTEAAAYYCGADLAALDDEPRTCSHVWVPQQPYRRIERVVMHYDDEEKRMIVDIQ